jgi:hypothetical protein
LKCRGGHIVGKTLIDGPCRILTREEVAAKFKEAGIPLPIELSRAARSDDREFVSEPAPLASGNDEPLPSTAELLLAGLEALSPEWHTADEIASRARLNTAISRVRETLSWMKRLGYVESGMKGYKRTKKPYPHQLPQV